MGRPELYSVAVELTPYCNQRCDYCYNAWRGSDPEPQGAEARELVLRRVRRLLDTFAIDHFTLTGGEPLAAAALFPLLELCAERGVPAQIISNGGLVTDALAARLATLRPRSVQITLNGPTAELHEAHVGRGHFEPTLAGVRHLTAHGIPVVGCVVVTRKNARHVGSTLELWRSLGARTIALSRFSPAGYASRHAAHLLPSRGDLVEAFEQAHPFAASGELTIACTMPVPPCAVEVERFPSLRFGYCPIGTSKQELALGSDGRLRNCTLFRDALGEVDIAHEGVDLTALLAAPVRSEYRRRAPEFCEGCLHVSSCGGGCGAAADWVRGDPRAYPDPFVDQHISDELGRELAFRREHGKTHLETIL